MHTLFEQGKIRAIGVSNFSVLQMERFRRVAPLHVLQPPLSARVDGDGSVVPGDFFLDARRAIVIEVRALLVAPPDDFAAPVLEIIIRP